MALFNAPSIRDASALDLAVLTEIAKRSKAHWGYDDAFMTACEAELAVTTGDLTDETVRIAESDGRAAGFYRLAEEAGDLHIEGFFVDPPWIGTGIGRHLWRDLEMHAARSGCPRLICQSDPNAAGFYRSMGMRESASIPGRQLPMFELAP